MGGTKQGLGVDLQDPLAHLKAAIFGSCSTRNNLTLEESGEETRLTGGGDTRSAVSLQFSSSCPQWSTLLKTMGMYVLCFMVYCMLWVCETNALTKKFRYPLSSLHNHVQLNMQGHHSTHPHQPHPPLDTPTPTPPTTRHTHTNPTHH